MQTITRSTGATTPTEPRMGDCIAARYRPQYVPCSVQHTCNNGLANWCKITNLVCSPGSGNCTQSNPYLPQTVNMLARPTQQQRAAHCGVWPQVSEATATVAAETVIAPCSRGNRGRNQCCNKGNNNCGCCCCCGGRCCGCNNTNLKKQPNKWPTQRTVCDVNALFTARWPRPVNSRARRATPAQSLA